MSILFRQRGTETAADLIPQRLDGRRATPSVSRDESFRHSVVWACLHLRASLISSSPVDVYRTIGNRALEVDPPPVIVSPDGSPIGIVEWLYSTQIDLDSTGNAFGIITARDTAGLPRRIDLVSADSVTVKVADGGIVEYRIGRRSYDPSNIWHERQFTRSGLPVGLSPIAHAAYSLSTGLSVHRFAADWFSGAAMPAAHLRNTAQTLDAEAATEVKARFKRTVSNGDVFVTGADWEYNVLGGKASESSFVEASHLSAADLCRFLGVPGDMVDVNEQTGSVTYANITQRNLQLLIMHLGPSIRLRELALSTLLTRPRYVKLNSDAVVLRMDPMTRAELNKTLLESNQRAPSEVREKDDLPPFTPEQVDEILTFKPQAAAKEMP